MCAADRNLRNMSASELSSLFHLVKPETDDPEGSGGTKIMSEVFLTRLLSTKVCENREVICGQKNNEANIRSLEI